jgi:hypothetical protein
MNRYLVAEVAESTGALRAHSHKPVGPALHPSLSITSGWAATRELKRQIGKGSAVTEDLYCLRAIFEITAIQPLPRLMCTSVTSAATPPIPEPPWAVGQICEAKKDKMASTRSCCTWSPQCRTSSAVATNWLHCAGRCCWPGVAPLVSRLSAGIADRFPAIAYFSQMHGPFESA